jgi:hypothetical protein
MDCAIIGVFSLLVGMVLGVYIACRCGCKDLITQEVLKMLIELKANQYVKLSVGTPKDKYGNDAAIESLEYSTSDSSVVELRDFNPEDSSVKVWPTGKKGLSTITAKADADLGSGVKEISGTLDVVVSAGEAATFELLVGVPSDKEEVPPPVEEPPVEEPPVE